MPLLFLPQGGDAGGGDARAGQRLPQGLVTWARWHCGHGGTMAASARRWHCVAQHKAPRWAKSWAEPNYGPRPCQIVSRAKPWVMPNHGLCQIVSHAKPGAVPSCGPHQVMSFAKSCNVPDWEPYQIPFRASPLPLGLQPRRKPLVTHLLQPRPPCPHCSARLPFL